MSEPSDERRQRYAAAMAKRDGHPWPTDFEDDERDYLRRADAAISVADQESAAPAEQTAAEPAPAGRAAVIAATARACAKHLRFNWTDTWTADAANSLELNAARIERGEDTALLRRLADDAQQPVPADRGTAAAIDETAATIQAEGAQR